MSHRTSLALLAILASPAGCGTSKTGTPVVDGGASDFAVPPDFSVAPPDLAIPLREPSAHPLGPDVGFGGGSILRQPDLITVVWSGDSLASQRADFNAWLATSSYLGLMAEYGARPGTARGPYFLKGLPPTTLDDSLVGALLRKSIFSGDLPAPVAGSLYIVYLDASTRSTLQGTEGCRSYGGYHSHTITNMQSPSWMAYAIIPNCNNSFDSETEVVTHEVVEAISDPQGGNGYRAGDLPYGEIGDLCTSLSTHVDATSPDGGVTATYSVTRFWSLKNATAGDVDPCVPIPDKPYAYFNAALDPEVLTLTLDDNNKAVATLLIEPFAYGPVGKISWHLHVDGVPGVSLSPSSGSGFAGSTQVVTVHANAAAVAGSYPIYVSTSSATGTVNVLYGAIVIQ